MYVSKIPDIVKPLAKNFVWSIDTEEKALFLTFDDGPIPEITPWVLNQLEKYDAKVTFFCVGDNVRKHPDIFKQVVESGHSIGNHTYNHLNGWKTSKLAYVKNTLECETHFTTNLMRPPYGRITRQQSQTLRQKFKIIMWDVLSGDFDQNITPEKCGNNVKLNAKPGSIIVFHDSKKAFPRLQKALPETLSYFSSLGYQFKALTPEIIHSSAVV